MIGKCEHCGTLFGPTEKRCEACGAPLPLVESWRQPGHPPESYQPVILKTLVPYINGGTWEAGSVTGGYGSTISAGTMTWRIG